MLRYGINHHSRSRSTSIRSSRADDSPKMCLNEAVDTEAEVNAAVAHAGEGTDTGHQGHSKTRGVPLIDALAFVKERRHVVSPNQGFMRQLIALESALHEGETTVDLALYETQGRFADVRTFATRPPQPIE